MILLYNLKCHCNEKIFAPILNTTEQHFHTSLNWRFQFLDILFRFRDIKVF